MYNNNHNPQVPQIIQYQEVCSDSDWCVVKIIPEPLSKDLLTNENEKATSLYEFGVSLAPEDNTDNIPTKRKRSLSEKKNSKTQRKRDPDSIRPGVKKKKPIEVGNKGGR